MRNRPAWHFTVQNGWTNDPHGIIYFGGEYHMFFQYNPHGVVWDRACHWGHATSPDLISWTEKDVALTPENEFGCWSGSAVVDGDRVVILYTAIRHEDFGRGAVALAESSGSLGNWQRLPIPDVIAGPPTDLEITAFRDPFVWKVDKGWKAILGAGIVGFGGTALQYSSPDLQTWRYDGPIAMRSNTDTAPIWTGKVWECPQLVQIGDKWLLMVSVWDDDVLHYVAYSIGQYDGLKFTADRWGRFSYGPSAYASTIFRDQDGTPILMSWIREENNKAPIGSDWASSMSLPFELSLQEDELFVKHHHNLFANEGVSFNNTSKATGAFALSMQVEPGTEIAFSGTGGQFVIRVGIGVISVVNEAGQPIMELPETRVVGNSQIEVSVDADILEITWSRCAGVGSVRVPANTATDIVLKSNWGAMLYQL